MIGWFPSSDSAESEGRDGSGCRGETDVSFVRRDEYTPEAERPHGPPFIQGDRHGLESAIGLPESVVGVGGMGKSDPRNPVRPMAWLDLDYRPHAYQVSPRWRESRQEIV